MTTPLFLKSDTFGSFNFTFVPQGGICPPGMEGTPVKCQVGPCPDMCVTQEPADLSGEPLQPGLPPTALEVAQGASASPAAAPPTGPITWLKWLWILLPVSLIVAATPRRAEGVARR